MTAPSPLRANRLEWALLLGAAVMGIGLWNLRVGVAVRPPAPGDTRDVRFTLITADSFDAACASGDESTGNVCPFRTPGERRTPVPDGARTLAPYLTPERTLYLVPGLFELPSLIHRLREEPPLNTPRDLQTRFTVACRAKLLARTDAHVRWLHTAPFGPPERAWIAEVTGCRIE